jgi:hypothetical protein
MVVVYALTTSRHAGRLAGWPAGRPPRPFAPGFNSHTRSAAAVTPAGQGGGNGKYVVLTCLGSSASEG